MIAQIRSDVWRYLTPAADVETQLLEASALLSMPATELQTVAQLQFLASRELGALLQQLPMLVRRLATTTTSEEEWSAERVRGSIQWSKTLSMRDVGVALKSPATMRGPDILRTMSPRTPS